MVYPVLFAAIGTAFNTGGEAGTEFRLPDLGGRVVAGKEASATRLTSGVSGINGATLAAAGGSQSHLHAVSLTEVLPKMHAEL